MKLCLTFSMILSTLFSMSSHPIILMAIILIQALILCFILWMLNSFSWFSYILFLIFLGGIMILFIYVSALASNEKFNFFSKLTFPQMLIVSFIFLMTFLLINSLTMKKIKISVSSLIFKLYSSMFIEITLMTMVYLIITLIVIVKIMSNYKGPLRSKY